MPEMGLLLIFRQRNSHENIKKRNGRRLILGIAEYCPTDKEVPYHKTEAAQQKQFFRTPFHATEKCSPSSADDSQKQHRCEDANPERQVQNILRYLREGKVLPLSDHRAEGIGERARERDI